MLAYIAKCLHPNNYALSVKQEKCEYYSRPWCTDFVPFFPHSPLPPYDPPRRLRILLFLKAVFLWRSLIDAARRIFIFPFPLNAAFVDEVTQVSKAFPYSPSWHKTNPLRMRFPFSSFQAS